MVDPFSIAAISGISALGGAVIGKYKNRTVKQDIPDSSVEFISVKETINPNQLLPFMENGIMLNLLFLDTMPDRLSEALPISILNKLTKLLPIFMSG